jgi:hypothetical protein
MDQKTLDKLKPNMDPDVFRRTTDKVGPKASPYVFWSYYVEIAGGKAASAVMAVSGVSTLDIRKGG